MKPADRKRVEQLLREGRTVQQVADLSGLPRAGILDMVRRAGWRFYSSTDTVLIPSGEGGDGEEAPTASQAALTPVSVDRLLAEARQIDVPALQQKLQRAQDAIGRLRQAVTDHKERVALEQEIAELEARLANARARLRAKRSRRGTPQEVAL